MGCARPGYRGLAYTDPFGLSEKEKWYCKAWNWLKEANAGMSQLAKDGGGAYAVLGTGAGGAVMRSAGGAIAARAIAKQEATQAASTEAAAATPSPLAGTTYTPKVQAQMGQDKYHGFPATVDQFAADGTAMKLTGGDGVVRTRVELPGAVNGRDGNYTWIVEPDQTVNHRQFEPK